MGMVVGKGKREGGRRKRGWWVGGRRARAVPKSLPFALANRI